MENKVKSKWEAIKVIFFLAAGAALIIWFLIAFLAKLIRK